MSSFGELVSGKSMLKKIAGFCLASMALIGCDQNVSTTLYVLDVEEMLAKSEPSQISVDISIEVLESGLAQRCSKPEGQELVEAVASVFEKASLVACEKVSGSLNDRMTIKATTLLFYAKPEEPMKSNYLLAFEAFRLENGTSSVAVTFNAEKYEDIQKRIRRVNTMASIKLSDASISVVVNNDLREPAPVIFSRGVFVDGKPADQPLQLQLNPRQEATVKLGDVKLAYLAQSGSALIFGLEQPQQQSPSN
ncbi:DUF7424 family protein [Brucella grignonensis]